MNHSLINRHANYTTMMNALDRIVPPYLEWLEAIITSTEALLTAERETNEYLASLVHELRVENAMLEGRLADAAVIAAESEGA